MTLCTPNSGAHELNAAPRLAVASIGTSVSGMLGAYAATRSPGPTPKRTTGSGPRDLVAQLGRGDSHLVARLRTCDHHDVVVIALRHPQHRLGVVEPDAGEPVGTGHGVRRQGR